MLTTSLPCQAWLFPPQAGGTVPVATEPVQTMDLKIWQEWANLWSYLNKQGESRIANNVPHNSSALTRSIHNVAKEFGPSDAFPRLSNSVSFAILG